MQEPVPPHAPPARDLAARACAHVPVVPSQSSRINAGAAVDSECERELWDAWRTDRCSASRDRLLSMHMEYARTMAALAYGRRFSDDVEFGDYLQYARIGLLEAFERFDPAHGVLFRTYAAHRIRGAIMDGVAHLSERQQQAALRRRVRQERATSLLEGAELALVGSAGLLEQLADVALGLAIGILLEDTGMFTDDAAAPTVPDAPYRSVALKQTRARLDQMVSRLPEPERRVIKQHYHHGHPFEQIAREVGVTKGRISQVHRQALQSLRAMLGGVHGLERS